MGRFDSVYPPVPLPDFRRVAPSGVSGISFESNHWDNVGNLFYGSDNLIDGCLHNGLVHVAWVEITDGLARGPFCSYWDGAAWNALGAEVEPGITPWNPLSPWGTVADGTRFVPARIRIGSDGEAVYVGYSLWVAERNPYDPTGSGSAVRGQWSPRRYVVSRWDGAAWSVFGEVLPATFNSQQVGGMTLAEYASMRQVFFSVSPADPGVVYAGFQETGYIPKLDSYYYFHGGDTHMVRLVISKLDGVTTDKVMDVRTIVAPPAGFTAVAPAMTIRISDIINDVGIPWLLYFDRSTPGVTSEELFDWNTLTAAQSINTGGPGTPGAYAGASEWFTTDPARDVYYMEMSIFDGAGFPAGRYLAEIARDGTTTWEDLDGLTPIQIGTARLNEGCPEPRNIWMIRQNFDSTIPPVSELWQYHRNCRGWRRVLEHAVQFFDPADDFAVGPVGNSRLLLIEDSLYVVAPVSLSPVTFPGGPTVLEPRVYKIDICRECDSCGFQAPAILGIYRPPPPPSSPNQPSMIPGGS